MPRSTMSSRERELRSRSAQWVNSHDFIRGTLNKRQIVCGNPNCKCAHGEKHEAFCLVRSKNGRIEQLHIPKNLVNKVRRLVKQYRDIYEKLEKLSDIAWVNLKSEKDE